MFARAVFNACVSEWVIANRNTTVGIIFRHITGKPRGCNAQPTPKMRELLLFCIRKYVEEVINGHQSTVIYFYDESPLLVVARVKNNQLLSFEPGLLNISTQANSSKNISVRHYVIQRVLECSIHKELKRKIKFSYVLEVCELINNGSKKKCEVIHEVIEIFEYLQSGGDIKSFVVKKNGEEYDSIEFRFPK